MSTEHDCLEHIEWSNEFELIDTEMVEEHGECMKCGTSFVRQYDYARTQNVETGGFIQK